jgi:hypothetical protein
MQLEIRLNEIGKITSGNEKGWFIKIEYDTSTMGYYVYVSDNENFMGINGFDNWVEKKEYVSELLEGYGWNVEWLNL